MIVKNAMDPQCFKWWEFPSIPGYWFSIRTYPKGDGCGLLIMNKPKNPAQMDDSLQEYVDKQNLIIEADFHVAEIPIEWDSEGKNPSLLTIGDHLVGDDWSVICKHFGLY